MYDLDPDQLIMVYMLTAVNRDRITRDPPTLSYDIEDERLRVQMEENEQRAAYFYDIYRDILLLSFLQNGQTTHLILCDDEDKIEQINSVEATRTMCGFHTEQELLKQAHVHINDWFREVQGISVDGKFFAGWKIYTLLWPLLVNKMFSYDLALPRSLTTDLSKRFSTLNNLLDVSSIYTQGLSFGMRKLPALPSVLKHWGFGVDEALRHPSPEDLQLIICDEPKTTVAAVEEYLNDMRQAVLRYYKPPRVEGENYVGNGITVGDYPGRAPGMFGGCNQSIAKS